MWGAGEVYEALLWAYIAPSGFKRRHPEDLHLAMLGLADLGVFDTVKPPDIAWHHLLAGIWIRDYPETWGLRRASGGRPDPIRCRADQVPSAGLVAGTANRWLGRIWDLIDEPFRPRVEFIALDEEEVDLEIPNGGGTGLTVESDPDGDESMRILVIGADPPPMARFAEVALHCAVLELLGDGPDCSRSASDSLALLERFLMPDDLRRLAWHRRD